MKRLIQAIKQAANYLMGVKVQEPQPSPTITIDELINGEDRYPSLCERMDCIVYGIHKDCYFERKYTTEK